MAQPIDAQEIAIDLLINGLDKLDKLNAGLRELRQAAAGVERSSTTLDRLGDSTSRVSRSADASAAAQIKAADAALRQAQATARLQQIQGQSEEAIKTLTRALDGFTGSQIQATRASIQLAYLQTNYANSPLISAIRGQAGAMDALGGSAGAVEAAFRRTARASEAVGESVSGSTGAILQQAQALARYQQLQGDTAAASNTLRAALQQVDEQQQRAVEQSTSLGSKLQTALQSATVVLQAVTAAFNFFNALQAQAQGELTDAEAAAAVVAKAYAGAKAAVGAVRDTLLATLPVFRTVGAEAQTAAKAAQAPVQAVVDEAKQRVEQAKTLFEKIREANEAQVRAGEQPAGPGGNIINTANALAFFAKIQAANEAFLKAGKEAGSSFAAGVVSAAGEVKKAGEALGKNAEKGIRDSLEQRSPSRVLLRLGKEAAESFAAGFEAGKAKLKAITAQDLVDRNTTTGPLDLLRARLEAFRSSPVGQVFEAIEAPLRRLVANFGELIATVAIAGGTLAGLGAGALALAGPLALIGRSGIEANKQLEQTRIGIASVIASVGELKRSDGVQLKGIDALNAALPLADKQLQLLRVDALQTALTFQQLAPAFLQAIGPGLAAGLDLDQIRRTVVSVSQLIVPLTGDASQLAQELRAIFSGDINQDAQVARTLGITRAQVEQAKEQGRLADLLNEKLKVAAATGQLMATTFEAATSNLAEAGTVLSQTVTKGFFDDLKAAINRTLPQVFEVAFGQVRIAPALSGLAGAVTQVFDRVGEFAARGIQGVFGVIGQISAFLSTNQVTITAIVDGVFAIFGQLMEAVTIVGRLLGGFLSLQSVLVIINSAIQFTRSTLAPIVTIMNAIVSAALSLARVFDGALAKPLAIVAQITLLALSFRGVYQAAVLLAPTLLSIGQELAALSLRAGQTIANFATLSTAATAARAALSFLFTTPLGLALVAASAVVAASSMGLFADSAKQAQEAAGKIGLNALQEQVSALAASREQLAKVDGLTGSQADLNREQERFREILAQLPPAQQAVIEKLGTQEARVKALREVLTGNIAGQESAAKAEQVLLAASISARQAEIDQIEKRIKALDAEREARERLLQTGTKETFEVVPTGAEPVLVTRDVTAEERNIARAREEAREALAKLNEEQTTEVQKLALTARALKQSEEALLDARKASFLTTDQFNFLKEALDRARASGQGIDQAIGQVTAALGGAKTAAEQAAEALKAFFASGDPSGLRKRVQDTIGRLAAAGAEKGQKPADVLRDLNAQLKANKDGIGDTVKALQSFEAIQKVLNERVSPSPRAGRAAPASTAQADFQNNIRIAESQYRIQLALAQQKTAFAQANEQVETAQLKEQLEQRRISVAGYFDEIGKLQGASVQAQIEAIILESDQAMAEITRIQNEAREALAKLEADRAKALRTAKDSNAREKVNARFDASRDAIETKAQVEVNNLVAKQIDLETKLATTKQKAAADEAKLETDRLKAFAKLDAEYTALSRTIQASLGAGFEAEVDKRLGKIQEEIRGIDAEARAQIEEKQALVARGLLSELQARLLILEIEKKASAEVKAQLDAAARLIQVLPDSEKKRQLAAENRLNQTQNANRAITPEEQRTADLRKGLTSDIKSAFEEFVANGKFSLADLGQFALGVVNGIRRALARIIGDFVEKRIIQPAVDFFLGKILGLQVKVDPATVANTAAVTANTAAVTALTAAILAKGAADAANAINEFGQPADVGSLLGDEGLGEQATSPVQSILGRLGGAIKGFGEKIGGVVGKIGGGLGSIAGAILGFVGRIFGAVLGGATNPAASGELMAGFAEGGFTGDGPTMAPAGVVHAGEFVQPAPVVRRWGAGFFEAIRTGAITPADISARVNSRILAAVTPRNPAYGMAAGGLVGGGAAASADVRINNVLVDDRRNALAALTSPEGVRTILTVLGRNRSAVNAQLQGA